MRNKFAIKKMSINIVLFSLKTFKIWAHLEDDRVNYKRLRIFSPGFRSPLFPTMNISLFFGNVFQYFLEILIFTPKNSIPNASENALPRL